MTRLREFRAVGNPQDRINLVERILHAGVTSPLHLINSWIGSFGWDTLAVATGEQPPAVADAF